MGRRPRGGPGRHRLAGRGGALTLRTVLVADPSAEEAAAWEWLSGEPGVRADRAPARAVEAALAGADVIWVHSPAAAALPSPAAVRAFVERGGGLLLTLRAASLVGPLGIESSPPGDIRDAAWRHDADELWLPDFRSWPAFPHVRGIAAYGAHPLFEGLHNGTYCWAPSEGERYSWACYSGGSRPADGRVVGVERAYVHQNADRIVAWEYDVGRGRVLCVGAFAHFAAPDRLLRPQLERLVAGALGCVGGAGEVAARVAWPAPGTVAVRSEGAVPLPEPLDLSGALPDPAEDPFALAGDVGADEAWDAAGRRTLVVGSEASGIREVWTHPHRTVARWSVRVGGEAARGTGIEVSGDVLRRTLSAGGRRVHETVFVALEHPVLVVDYSAAPAERGAGSSDPPLLELDLRLDLRRMWPFPAGCGGNLRFRPDRDGRVAVVDSESGDGIAVLFSDRSVPISLAADDPGPAVRCVVSTPLAAPLRLAVVGATDREDLGRSLRAARRLGVEGLVRQRRQRILSLREARVAVRSGDAAFDRSVEWAKRRADAFVADTPRVGRSLLAGYAASRPGWGEARPGYSWYFGRDACWTSLGLLASGEVPVVRQVLRFLGDRQDVTGKVLHEATTSGQFHYDAADSTPLFLLLASRFLDWTGDVGFLRALWPKLERAYRFCLSTDTDGDGLIENTRVGHGWIESGPLSGAHVTFYLASLWLAALEGLARSAAALGHARFETECRTRAARAFASIEDRLHDESRGTYALDLRADGSATWVDTALLAVPLALGAASPARARRFLDALAGPAFTAPWGVRLLPAGHPLFDPGGYHSGAVWPLYTGWAALAEYRAGRGGAGFAHLSANAALAYSRQRGAFDEVLHGLVERGAGVCADQAWSAAMVLQPLVEGLLGVDPDAVGGRLTIAPQLPAEWPSLDVEGLACGGSRLDLRIRRKGRDLLVAVRRAAGEPLWLTLAPWVPEVPGSTRLDDEEVRPALSAWGEGIRAAVSFQATAEHELRVTPG